MSFTYKDLLNRLKTLSEEQLNQSVSIYANSDDCLEVFPCTGTGVTSVVAILDEDHFVILMGTTPPTDIWIDWRYTPECKYPDLDEDTLISVRFPPIFGSYEYQEPDFNPAPASYWHNDGATDNNFHWSNDLPTEYEITAYKIERY